MFITESILPQNWQFFSVLERFVEALQRPNHGFT